MMLQDDSQDTCSAARLIRGIRSPFAARIVVAFTIFAVVWLHDRGSISVLPPSSTNEEVHEAYQEVNRTDTCVDALDVDACQCAHPLNPSRRIKPNKARWDEHHHRLVRIAEAAQGDLDFVMIGDSITERWGLGTRGMGKNSAPEFKETFDQFFDKNNGGKLQGLALASSGDTGTELLWHLRNGMLPETLRPKVWVILIGTNDLGRGCSKNNTLTAISEVTKYVHLRQPGVPILVHGLLPRRDLGTKNYTLGTMWKEIIWINRQLKRFCADNDSWHFMEARKLFLKVESEGDLEIDEQAMKDGMHPTVMGYKRWGPKIANQVKTIIEF